MPVGGNDLAPLSGMLSCHQRWRGGCWAEPGTAPVPSGALLIGAGADALKSGSVRSCPCGTITTNRSRRPGECPGWRRLCWGTRYPGTCGNRRFPGWTLEYRNPPPGIASRAAGWRSPRARHLPASAANTKIFFTSGPLGSFSQPRTQSITSPAGFWLPRSLGPGRARCHE